jgi:Tol biopolymer transport system component
VALRCPSRGAARAPLALAAWLLCLSGITTLAQSAPGDFELISVKATAAEAAGSSSVGRSPNFVSADGRYVAFASYSAELVLSDESGNDVFIRDRQAGATYAVSLNSKLGLREAYSPSLSSDGRYVAFETVDEGFARVWFSDWPSGLIKPISVGPSGQDANATSGRLSISGDGQYVAFDSRASNLVFGDTNGWKDIFVRNVSTNRTRRVSVTPAGAQANGNSFGPVISADGRYVAFGSEAENLISGDTDIGGVVLRDRLTGENERLTVDANGKAAIVEAGHPCAMSPDARYVVFFSTAATLVAGDTNGLTDAFMRDRQLGHTERINVSSNGAQANGEGDYFECAISSDGRYVAFASRASNLVPGDISGFSDVFLRDRLTKQTRRISEGIAGAEANADSAAPALSADGGLIVFGSKANNFGLIDTNFDPSASRGGDVYLRERPPATNLTVSPKSLAFGNRVINTTSAPKAITVTNISTAPVAITGVNLAGANPGQFARTHNCGSSLAAGAKCTVNVVFKPTSLGAKSASLKVNGGGGGLRTVSLTGTGIR